MEKSAPTRQRLLELKGGYAASRKGLELLKSKREALMKEFFGVVDESVRMREALTELLSGAQKRLVVSRALYGDEALESFAHSAKRDVSLDINVKNIWGVNVPEIEDVVLSRSLDARDISPVGEKAGFFQAARDFENAAGMMVKIASKEIKLSLIGEMIKSDTRKINAITEVLLPSMRTLVRSIERVLEEREREEVFRLKRYKKMRGAPG